MGTRHTVVAAVVVLTMTAGCLAQPSTLPSGEDPGIDSGFPSGEYIHREPASRESGRGPGRAIDPDGVNRQTPWGTRRVIVGIDTANTSTIDERALVRRALTYWERNDHRYAEYVAEFVLEPAAKDPDVLVEFTDTVVCHGTVGWLGCAPTLTATSNVTTTQVIQIRAGMEPNVTLRTLKHELGHLMGIDHGEAPMPLMSAARDAPSRPRPDAVDRAFPWRDDRIAVFVAYDQLSADRRPVVRPEIRRAVQYYDAGRGGLVPEPVNVTLVDDRRGADIVIEFPPRRWCGEGAGSCGYTWGVDLDTDGALEYYSQSRIVIVNVPSRTVGWHVGHWIGKALGAETRAEMPPIFREGNRSVWIGRTTRFTGPAIGNDIRIASGVPRR